MEQVLRRLYALGPGRMEPGRDRLRRLLECAGDPHLKVPGVLVGGTNGKGRVVAGLSSCLSRRYKTGAFIKPHLKSIRERWRINDEPVDVQSFEAAAQTTLELVEAHDEPISFFEANVLLGALLFRDAGCGVAIWEIGLGGREDACNLVEPVLSILTNVGYDHQKILGDTLPEIARDKAHICRNGRILVLGPPRSGWEAAYREYAPVVAEVCAGAGASLLAIDPPPDDAWDSWFEQGGTGMPVDSGSIIRKSLEILHGHGFELDAADIDQGIQGARYRARMEHTRLQGRPVLLDAAHNVDSFRWLAKVLEGNSRRSGGSGYPVVFGCQSTREPIDLLQILAPVITELIPIEIPVMHPCPVPRIIAAAGELGLPVSLPEGFAGARGGAAGDVPIGNTTELDEADNSTGWIECVRHGLTKASGSKPVVICGSIYYIGEILRAFEP